MEPHHRRRRWLAVAALIALVVGAILLVAGGGGGVHTPAAANSPRDGFFGQIDELAGSGAGSLVARETAAENAAINRTLAYTPYVRIAGSQHREIALTFDDGPGPYTPQILSLLERHDVPATFFEVGVLERYFYGSTAAIVADGDAIGDHTEGHAAMSRLPLAGNCSPTRPRSSGAARGSRGCSARPTECGTGRRLRCCTAIACSWCCGRSTPATTAAPE
jgi:hypothetical protein